MLMFIAHDDQQADVGCVFTFMSSTLIPHSTILH